MTPQLFNILFYPALDHDVRAWIDETHAGGGLIGRTAARAADRYARRAKNHGLLERTLMADLCCGDNLTAALSRFKVPNGVARAYTNNNFVSGDYSERAGMTGNGSTKYLDSGLNPVTLGWSASDLMLWCVTRTDNVIAGSTRMTLGVDVSSTNSLQLGWMASGSKESVCIASSGAGAGAAGSATPLTGLLGGGTAGSRSQQCYRNGVAVGSASSASASLPSAILYKFANNVGTGTAQSHTPRTLSSAFITSGLTAAEIVTLYNIVAEFEAALGRAIPS